ncbi:MAG: UDP-2,4-diacetamido-2,4,6-trideoxy-beta-L-altropyranose hydrolase [Clostridium lundense]|nr:UDP-2,4-diacetamido-2,4,6-trideoxy-beta-L-altropyranose hydrolase [Clostridium lundense]
MKIAIRADGGSQIGMGHIMRTLVLAKELSKTNDVFYICKENNDKYKKGIEKVSSEGFKVLLVRDNYLLEDLKNIDADLLITDSYDVNEEYFNKTKKIFNKTSYIDDMNLHYFNVDFLINQNIDAEDFNYRVSKDTKLMLGTKYVMLRDEFRNCSPKNIKEKVNDIMLTVGGSDLNHITEKILSWSYNLDYTVHVVVGPSFNDIEKLKSFESDKIKLYFNADMSKLMKKCDMAISTCGSTLYELASCGVSTLGIIIADNQSGIGCKLNDMKVIKNLGWYNEITKECFINNVNELAEDYNKRKLMSEKASMIVDGRGVERICEILMLQ